jgi:hypothetical protein
MQIISAGISVIIFFVVTITVGSTALNGWLKAAIVIPAIFLVVYSLARMQPKELKSGNESRK